MPPGGHGGLRIVVLWSTGEPRLHSARPASGVHRPPPQGGDGRADLLAHFAAGGELLLRGGECARQLPHLRRGTLVAPWVSRSSLAARPRWPSHHCALACRALSLSAIACWSRHPCSQSALDLTAARLSDASSQASLCAHKQMAARHLSRARASIAIDVASRHVSSGDIGATLVA